MKTFIFISCIIVLVVGFIIYPKHHIFGLISTFVSTITFLETLRKTFEKNILN